MLLATTLFVILSILLIIVCAIIVWVDDSTPTYHEINQGYTQSQQKQTNQTVKRKSKRAPKRPVTQSNKPQPLNSNQNSNQLKSNRATHSRPVAHKNVPQKAPYALSYQARKNKRVR